MKILVSPGFGAGWSTWEYDKDISKAMLTYEPLIDAIEADDDGAIEDALEMLRTQYPNAYLGGADQLIVVEVNSPCYIEEYDGSETVVYGMDVDWIVP